MRSRFCFLAGGGMLAVVGVGGTGPGPWGVGGGAAPSAPESDAPRGVLALMARSICRLCCVGYRTMVDILALGVPFPFCPSAGALGAGMFSLSFSSSAVFSAAGAGRPLVARFSLGYGTKGEGVWYGV